MVKVWLKLKNISDQLVTISGKMSQIDNVDRSEYPSIILILLANVDILSIEYDELDSSMQWLSYIISKSICQPLNSKIMAGTKIKLIQVTCVKNQKN